MGKKKCKSCLGMFYHSIRLAVPCPSTHKGRGGKCKYYIKDDLLGLLDGVKPFHPADIKRGHVYCGSNKAPNSWRKVIAVYNWDNAAEKLVDYCCFFSGDFVTVSLKKFAKWAKHEVKPEGGNYGLA